MENNLITEECFNKADKDFKEAAKQLESMPPLITIFGSARLKENTKVYQDTVEISKRISEEGCGVITGGGPGIMEAANRGCEINSVGLNIVLPMEESVNKYVTVPLNFKHFFARKLTFVSHSKGFVVMPGGMGTLDEIGELLVLVQNKMIREIPIVLFGKDFFEPFDKMIDKMIEYGCVSKEDKNLYIITDDYEEVIKHLKIKSS